MGYPYVNLLHMSHNTPPYDVLVIVYLHLHNQNDHCRSVYPAVSSTPGPQFISEYIGFHQQASIHHRASRYVSATVLSCN